ncbi:pectinesterase [Arachis ipaensis]|uniref:pectinesterase n=1 Tax=Arachis ipaensis TaxID=130454 RepID=UPI0007AF3EE7|nr:pectinesterase [Arachis ipaensis]XP_025645121.1 pectinesterase [Arachis hypogaea]QHO05445.1 Putative pectinesterase/pectinesterase inhibitor [Arachis hypogaea]
MAFQDFDVISERRRNEQKAKLKKRIIMGVVAAIVLVGIIGAVFVVVLPGNDSKSNSTPSSHSPSSSSYSSSSSSPPSIAKSEKMVELVCDGAEYKDKCEGPLSDALKNDPSMSQPKDILKYYAKYAEDAVNAAFAKTETLNFESPEEQGAYEDCKQIFSDAKIDLEAITNQVSGDNIDLRNITNSTPDLNSWLSAVISYQQTCIDGFPEGQLKTDLENLFKDSKEFVSNTLNIVSKVGNFLSSLPTFRSLAEEKHQSPLDFLDKRDGFPNWLSQKDRRMLKAADNKPTPNVTVAKDGSGDFKTISEALAAMPKTYEGRYVIFVKEGVYDETVTITQKMQNVTLFGEGSQKSIITGNKNFRDGTRTFLTAPFAVLGDGFIGKSMGFRNTAGPEGHQAVAARVQADRVVFVNCRFEGYQDTLYAQTHRQFYRSCIISGTIDFIFGDAAAVFQNCIMVVRKPMDNQQTIITAQGRVDPKQTTGIVLQKCIIKADDSLVPVKAQFKNYLGRPWKEYSRTVIMESDIGDLIHPEGWLPWAGDFALKTLYYAEYANTGPGSKTDGRVNWPTYHVINKQEAAQFTVAQFLKGSWVQGTGVPSVQGFYN